MIDIHAADFLFTPRNRFLFYGHMRAIGRNVKLLAAYKVPTVVMNRNLLDCIVSWKESCDIDHAAGRGDQYIFAPIYGAKWDGLTEEQKYEWILYNVVPWYYSFYQSWKGAAKVMPIHRIWNKDFYENQETGFQGILDFLGAGTISREKLTELCSPHDGKFNVGVAGRGRDLLTHSYIKRVAEQTLCWGADGDEMYTELIDRE
jgi:hypothetical protein